MIVVDAGHGGTDPGASGNGIVEKDYALMISKYIYDRFKEMGVPVAMTRTTDETVTPEERVRRVLAAFGDKPDVIVLANHLNAGGGDGAEVVYALRDKDTLARIILEEMAKEGQNIRKWYQRRLPSDTSKDYYFIIRNTGVTEPVLIEYGFVDNANDATLIKSSWKKLAEAVVRAVSIYKGLPYKSIIEGNIYTVQSGDSLWTIAKRFNVGVQEIKDLNGLTSNLLSVGQQLKIPGLIPPSEAGQINYVVQKGDSLYDIAIAYNTTVTAIKQLNNLTTNALSIGQILKIPTTSAPSVPVPTEQQTYTVKAGDSLYSIAQKFGVSAAEIRNLNNLTSNLLSIGQVLLIPIPAPTVPEGEQTYVVQKGDSLYSIAQKFGVSVSTLRDINSLTSDLLSVGQELIIPASEPSGGIAIPTITTYTVKSGDSLWTIAEKFGTTVTELKTLNNLSSNLLSIGQVLKVPTGTTPTSTTTYTVKSGDSLWTIAEKFAVSVSAIKQANNLTSDLLSIGQELTIPAPTRSLASNSFRQVEEVETKMTGSIRYRVQRGDTLYSIAMKYGVTVDDIRKANNLQTDILIVGQELAIPNVQQELPSEFTVTTYKVQKGDTLWGLAHRYGITISTLKRLNNLQTEVLSIGQEILVPINVALPTVPGATLYIIQRGDTLYSIANKFKTSVNALRELNKLENDILGVGQILAIPLPTA